MKKTVRTILSAAFVGSLLLTTSVATAATTTTSSGSTTPSTAPTGQSAATKKTTLADRVEVYKTKQTLKLTTAQLAATKLKCKAAQVVSKTLTTKVTTNNTLRTEAYDDIKGSLGTIITRLDDADVDTTDLKAQQAQLTKLIATYNTDVTEYKAVLADVNDVDCITDPAAYRATLESARTSRATVATDAQSIRKYVTDTVKPSLKTAQTRLTANKENQ